LGGDGQKGRKEGKKIRKKRGNFSSVPVSLSTDNDNTAKTKGKMEVLLKMIQPITIFINARKKTGQTKICPCFPNLLR
jgi:hypothetical protein